MINNFWWLKNGTKKFFLMRKIYTSHYTTSFLSIYLFMAISHTNSTQQKNSSPRDHGGKKDDINGKKKIKLWRKTQKGQTVLSRKQKNTPKILVNKDNCLSYRGCVVSTFFLWCNAWLLRCTSFWLNCKKKNKLKKKNQLNYTPQKILTSSGGLLKRIVSVSTTSESGSNLEWGREEAGRAREGDRRTLKASEHINKLTVRTE